MEPQGEQWRHLDALVTALTEAERPEDVAAAIAERVTQALEASGCVVAILEETGHALEIAAAVGYPPEFIDTYRRVELSSPLLIAEVARTHRPVWLPVVSPDRLGPPDLAEHQAFLAVPMLVGRRLVGVLAFGFPSPRESYGTESFIQAIAGQSAHALERSQLLEAERDAHEAETAAAERLAFLAEASVLLAGSLDLDATLDSLARLVVPRLADWCVVHIAGADGEIEAAALHHWDPDRHAGIAEMLATWPSGQESPYGAAAVIASGTTQLFPTVPESMLREIAGGDEGLLAKLLWLWPSTGLVVPLTVRSRAIGALTMARDQGSSYTPAQLALAEDLGRRAGLAVDNARIHSLAQRALEERDEAAAQAGAERDRLMALLEQLPIGVLFAEAPSGRVVLQSGAIDEALGEPLHEFLGKLDRLTITSEGAPVPVLPLDLALREGEVVRAQRLDVTWPSGRRRYLEVNAGPVRDRQGQITGAVAAVSDITQRVEHEQALARSTARSVQLAHSLQASLLPPDLPDLPGAELATAYHAVGEGLEVGGDFYDLHPTGRDDEWSLVIGDVCGKGVEAAAVTSLARYTLRAAALRARRPSVILSELNRAMLRQETERPFVTAVYAVLRTAADGLAITLAVGGHPTPLVLRANGHVEPVGTQGALIGVIDDPDLADSSLTLSPGEALVLYTDGLTEARRGREQFGEARLAAALRGCAGLDAAGIVAGLESALAAFTAEPARDDLALLVVRAT